MWLVDRDIEGWSLLVQMQTGIDCTELLNCLVLDMICRKSSRCRQAAFL